MRKTFVGNATSKLKLKDARCLSVVCVALSLSLAQLPAAVAQSAPITHSTLTIGAAPAAPPVSAHASPVVPSSANIITPSIAANLAKVVNAPQLVIDVGNLQNGVYAITGNFINTHNLTFVSSNQNIHTATLAVTGSIFNPVGASLSTLIPSGYSNAVANLNLVLNAQTGIFNAGSIVSAGALSMSAPVVANVHPSTIGALGPSPIMQAMTGDVGILTSTLLNQGTISTVVGNINISNLTNVLAVNALGGTFNAANGQGLINIGIQNLTDQLDLQILGGDFISNALNLNAGAAGSVNMQANLVSGVLNVSGCNAIVSSESSLTLGNLNLGADPIFESNGDVTLTASDLVGLGPLDIRANGSIIDNAGSIDRLGPDGYVNLVAGRDILIKGSVTATGLVDLFAAGGSLSVGSVRSSASTPLSGAGLIPYTVYLFAHNSIQAGGVSGQYVLVRGGGTASGVNGFPGNNPGSVQVGGISNLVLVR